MDNTQQIQEFRAIVERSLRVQKIMFYTLGVMVGLIGLGMSIGYMIPTEEPTPIAVLIIGICMLAAGIWIVAYYRAQNKNTLDLLFHRTHDIQEIKLVVIKRGNMGNMYSLHFIDKNKAKRGVIVPSESYAESIRRMYLG